MSDYKNWEKLDNTAHLFPVIAGEQMTNTYRISVCLKEAVDPEILQEALDIVLPKFPGFNVRLRIGLFWYYFEENGKPAPRVVEEDSYPCRYIHQTKNNSYMFRLTYYGNRIHLEVFHVLADGMGAIAFLREITYQYLRLKHDELSNIKSDTLSADTSLEREDGFLSNYRTAHKPNYKYGKSFIVKGEKLSNNGMGVIHGFMPIPEIKAAGKKYGASINEYIVATYIYSAYKNNIRKVTKKRPIRVAVPVNLRPYFESFTTKNFFAMVSAEFIPEKMDYDFAEIVEITKQSLREQITKENLEAIFSYNVSNEMITPLRAVPLPIKNLAINYVYLKSAAANTTTITNIGNIHVEPEYEDYIENFLCCLSFSKGQYLKATIASYRDNLVLTYTSAFRDTSIQRGVFSQIAEDGVNVRIETNGVYYG